MRVAAGHGEAFSWIEERTGCVLTRNARAIEARDDSGRIRGVVAYDNWTENAVQLHMAVDFPAVWRSLIRPGFSYAFEECRKGLLIGVIAADNPRSLKMTKRLGFRETYRIQDGWAAGVDLIVHELRRADCRWLKTGDC